MNYSFSLFQIFTFSSASDENFHIKLGSLEEKKELFGFDSSEDEMCINKDDESSKATTTTCTTTNLLQSVPVPSMPKGGHVSFTEKLNLALHSEPSKDSSEKSLSELLNDDSFDEDLVLCYDQVMSQVASDVAKSTIDSQKKPDTSAAIDYSTKVNPMPATKESIKPNGENNLQKR